MKLGFHSASSSAPAVPECCMLICAGLFIGGICELVTGPGDNFAARNVWMEKISNGKNIQKKTEFRNKLTLTGLENDLLKPKLTFRHFFNYIIKNKLTKFKFIKKIFHSAYIFCHYFTTNCFRCWFLYAQSQGSTDHLVPCPFRASQGPASLTPEKNDRFVDP